MSHAMRDFLILLDKSGSMSGCREAAITHFNSTVRKIQERSASFEGETFVSLIVFSSNVDIRFWRQPLGQLREIDYTDYNPNGMTALHDAIGITLTRLTAELPCAKHPIMLSVITDGEDTSSNKYRDRIAPMIKECQAQENWTFLYLGANHNVVTTSSSLGFSSGNTATFRATTKGFSGAASYTADCLGAHMDNLDKGNLGTRAFYGTSSVNITEDGDTSDDNGTSTDPIAFTGRDVGVRRRSTQLLTNPPGTLGIRMTGGDLGSFDLDAALDQMGVKKTADDTDDEATRKSYL